MTKGIGCASHLTLIGLDKNKKRYAWVFVIILSSLLLSIFSVYDQFFHRVGFDYIWDEQLRFHRWVIDGMSIDPWQYRIFSPYLIEISRYLFEFVGWPFSYARIFFGVRLVQNFLIFLLFNEYLSRYKINRRLILLGLAILAWGFTYSGYGSGLAFDTYFDLLFYLLAAIAILRQKPFWIIPISIIAALNRETGILIPAMLFTANFKLPIRQFFRKREFYISLISLLLFIAVLASVRIAYGPRSFLGEHPPGLSLLKFNLSNFYSYFSAVATFSIIPLVAIIHYKKWPSILRRFFWMVVPIWVLVHLFTGIIAEARLFLMPYIIILLPAAMLVSQGDISQMNKSPDV